MQSEDEHEYERSDDGTLDGSQPSPSAGVVGQVMTYQPKTGRYAYVIRFKPFSQDGKIQLYDAQTVENDFLIKNKFSVWAIGEELSPKVHYHMYIESKKEIEEIKKLVREFVYPYYPNRTRGFGSQTNTQLCEDPLNALRYLQKQKGYINYSGLTDELMQYCKDTSFQKSESDLQQVLSELYKRFENYEFNEYVYGSLIAKAYVQNGRESVNWNQIQNYINSKIILRKEDDALVQAKKFLRF